MLQSKIKATQNLLEINHLEDLPKPKDKQPDQDFEVNKFLSPRRMHSDKISKSKKVVFG